MKLPKSKQHRVVTGLKQAVRHARGEDVGARVTTYPPAPMTPIEIAARAHFVAGGSNIAWDRLKFWRPHSIQMMTAAFAALNVAGYKIVLREPTEPMRYALRPGTADSDVNASGIQRADRIVWTTMWDAAEPVTLPNEDEDSE